MGQIVQLSDVKSYLAIPQDDTSKDVVLNGFIGGLENLFSVETGDVYGPAENDYVDLLDGHGTHGIITTKPIKLLKEIKVTYGFVNDQIIFIDITQGVVYRVGEHRIMSRVYCFPEGKLNIQLTYDTVANQPQVAKSAILDVCAQMYRSMGSEDVRSEHLGDYQHVMRRAIDESLMWTHAVGACQRPQLG